MFMAILFNAEPNASRNQDHALLKTVSDNTERME